MRMRIAITGGGTGGHIYPALEVGLAAQAAGAEVIYLGSFRGMERTIAEAKSIPFFGVDAQPLWSLKTLKGWQSLSKLILGAQKAKGILRDRGVDAVFSTGGYSAGPFMQAAKSLRIPYVVHESNSVPGRANRLYGKTATAFTYVFHGTEKHVPEKNRIRTGQPIRGELRDAATAKTEPSERASVLVMGGSQGARFVNTIALDAAKILPDVHFTIATGEKLFEEVQKVASGLPNVVAVPYLSGQDLTDAYSSAGVFVGRSGGTLAEVAAFGLPSVLIPLPTSADDHQYFNATEFKERGFAEILWQGATHPHGHEEAIGDSLAQAIMKQLYGPTKEQFTGLRSWDCPNATQEILGIIMRS